MAVTEAPPNNDLIPEWGALKDALRAWGKNDPIDALALVVLGGGVAFYLAERETNPQCKTAWDGILYMATALSVGYDNLFPSTPTGHALATFAQTFGPALANSAFETPAPPDDTNRQILERLDKIVQLLEQR
jgi:voltage-gated potassium channel